MSLRTKPSNLGLLKNQGLEIAIPRFSGLLAMTAEAGFPSILLNHFPIELDRAESFYPIRDIYSFSTFSISSPLARQTPNPDLPQSLSTARQPSNPWRIDLPRHGLNRI
jgi:hypothetical protein